MSASGIQLCLDNAHNLGSEFYRLDHISIYQFSHAGTYANHNNHMQVICFRIQN